MKRIYKEKLVKLLSCEYNCGEDDFYKNENVLTESALSEGRRRYSDEKYFFHMVTLGTNAVVTADRCLHPFLEEYLRGQTGHCLFELPRLMELERELNKYSYTLTPTYHMFLPGVKTEVSKDLRVVWYYDKEILPFYGDERFPNAICEEYLSSRPDRIAVTAMDGDKIMGMAGCSEDAPGWMQIGVDVVPEYRSRGIGTYLVSLIKNVIERSGNVPFYGTGVSNYHSWNIALNCGFRPSFVEIGANKIER